MKELDGVAGWSAHVEEVLSWLLEAEDHLLALNSLGQKHLMTVKTRQDTGHTALGVGTSRPAKPQEVFSSYRGRGERREGVIF